MNNNQTYPDNTQGKQPEPRSSSHKNNKMKFRLGLDIGSQSIGWTLVRLDNQQPPKPVAIIKSGVRIFGDGRNPKDGSSLAATRRTARLMRRRRDRLLRRKTRLVHTLIEYGFFPADKSQRKVLEQLNPYQLRAKGLDHELTPAEFARAIFHLNQRRGFKSNRKTDKADNDSGALKSAISQLKRILAEDGFRTVGEWLFARYSNNETVRARYRERPMVTASGTTKTDKYYDLYIDRDMVKQEFDFLWAVQASFNPAQYSEDARKDIEDCLFFQRPLKPVPPGRCTLLPDEPRAPLALPSQQRFRIYQEVNHLRILQEGLREGPPLSCADRDRVATTLEKKNLSFGTALPKLLGMPGSVQFNLADEKRTQLKGNATSLVLQRKDYFGQRWHEFDLTFQDEIVMRLLNEENEARLIRWLIDETGVDEACAEAIANVSLPEGYGSLSAKALGQILPELIREVQTYDKAVKAAGFHHSRLSDNDEVPGRTFPQQHIRLSTGEIVTSHVFHRLPYYGEFLRRHVGFADPDAGPDATDEKRFGRIPNPTVHIALNQIRVLVNALIQRYGHPQEVIVELARELKLSKIKRDELNNKQAINQRRNERLREQIAGCLQIAPERVSRADIQKMILWEELSNDPAKRLCPYSGQQLSLTRVLSPEVEVDHILPFSKTLDDSLNNKVVALRQANRVKGNRSPWEARHDFAAQGWSIDDIQQRALEMPDKRKRDRFAADAMDRWLNEDQDFLARALTDTQYISRVTKEYLSLICPQSTRAIPGTMTAKLRHYFGLNEVLGLRGEKNRNDHRHHAVDACVIAVTDQGMLQRFANASKQADDKALDRLVESMPLPWCTYPDHVSRAIRHIWVSHRPDHGYQGNIFDATIYGLRGKGQVTYRHIVDNQRQRPLLRREVVEMIDTYPVKADGSLRHGVLPSGDPKPYMGLWSRSNFCFEVVLKDNGKWAGNVIERYKAYQIVAQHGIKQLYQKKYSNNGNAEPLVMRLVINDLLIVEINAVKELLRVLKINGAGSVTLVRHNDANVAARYTQQLKAKKDKEKGGAYDLDALNDNFFQQSFSPEALRACRARLVSVSPIGILNDPGFAG